MKEQKHIGPKSMYYSGTIKGAVAWANELIERFGPTATLPEVSAALLKEQAENDRNGSSDT